MGSEHVPTEMTKQGPLCMNQYKYLFGITRVPKPECDTLAGSYPPKSRHIIVLVRDQIFVMDVVREDGVPLSPSEIRSYVLVV